MNELALFAGGGGSILAAHLLGWRTRCAVEIDAGARQILLDRQRDGVLEHFPIWDDVRTFDGTAWRGLIDVVTGGFPCQDISQCGKGAGIGGQRSGLWVEQKRIICEVRPKLIVVENSPMLTTRGFGTVLGDLAEMGFDARWGVFRASAVGAAHHRARLYVVAHPHGSKLEGVDFSEPIEIDTAQSRRRQSARAIDAALSADDYTSMPRNPNDVARGMDGLKATGNGWVPKVAARAVRILTHNA
ncbi:MAG: DNA cytosine methyltransferase [Gallionellaceae bacterium]|nr:DNA cytosine methyltransferase [Gallionellaceae bacterium]